MLCPKIAEDRVNGWFISTIKLPFDHGFYDGEVLWYETIVFPTDANGAVTSYVDVDMQRYETVEQALVGHQKMLEKYKNETSRITGDS